MTWLWFVGPLVVGLVYALTNWRDHRREVEIERWRKQMGRRDVTREESSAYRGGKEVTKPRSGARRVTSMPGPLTRILEATGGGDPLDYFELVSKLAYLAVMGADALQGSEHQTVVARLDEASPTFTVRPLPIIEGERAPNTGVQFKKDADFMALFLVERGIEGGLPVPLPADEATDKAIRKWLSPPLRAALLELPAGWLRIDGKAKVMAFTLYGSPDAERMDELIAAADIVFAEYGAEGGPSLLGDDEEDEAAPIVPTKTKVTKDGAAKPASAKTKQPKPKGSSPASSKASDKA